MVPSALFDRKRSTGASLMPAYGAQRAATEVDDLVAYLASLRGTR